MPRTSASGMLYSMCSFREIRRRWCLTKASPGIDADRLSRILTMLSAAGEKGNQSLLFSCRQLEGEIVQELLRGGDGTDQVIRLGGEN